MAQVKADGGGLRYNTGKTRYSLIPSEWTRALAEVLTRGAEKYAPRNWERGMDHSIMLDCLGRHIDAFTRGERYDSETGCHHLAHAAWNVLALMTYDLRQIGKADVMQPPLKHSTRVAVAPIAPPAPAKKTTRRR